MTVKNPTKTVKHPTHHPSTGKGTKWTGIALKSIVAGTDKDVQVGDYISDGGGLEGLVKFEIGKAKICIYFRYGFKFKNEEAGERKSCSFYCGKYPDDSLATIREERNKAQELVSKGIDPREQKKADDIKAQQDVEKVIRDKEIFEAENKTVEDLYNDWINSLNRINNNKDVADVFIKHVIPYIGKIKVRDITEEDIRCVFERTLAIGIKRTTDELISTTKQMFNWGDQGQPWRGLMVDGNPTARIKLKDYLTKNNYKRTRQRLIIVFEIWQLNYIFETADIDFEKANDKKLFALPLKKEYQLAIWLCLSTLCRIGEISQAEWAHINVSRRMWFFPAENTKGKLQDHTVYFSDFTFEILKKLRRITGHSKWLFPSERIKDRCITNKVITHRIRERQIKFAKQTEIPPKRVTNNSLVLGDSKWFPHDLRRTGATMMQSLKVDREIINLCQNHVVGSKVDKSYLLDKQLADKKEAWKRLGDCLFNILEEKNPRNLIELDNYAFSPDLETEDEDDAWGA